MAMVIGDASLKTLYLRQILMERTDEEHVLNASELMQILHSEYGVEISRFTVYTEIEKLIRSGIDIEMQEGRGGGYFVANRCFELAELKLLVDSVQNSKFITEKKSRELIGKLESLCSKNEAKQLTGQVVICNRPKTGNETIYYNVDMIHSAIYRNRKISYQYGAWTVEKKIVLRHGGAFYVVSPLHLIWDDENYYMIGYDEKSREVRHYRVDKMRSMQILPEGRSQKALEEKIDLADFSRKTFGMFSGRDEIVTFEGKRSLVGVFLDRFGTGIYMRPSGEDSFVARVTVTVSPMFFGWVSAIGKELIITGPREVVSEYKSYLKALRDNYGDGDGKEEKDET